jgi:hypothetical protein
MGVVLLAVKFVEGGVFQARLEMLVPGVKITVSLKPAAGLGAVISTVLVSAIVLESSVVATPTLLVISADENVLDAPLTLQGTEVPGIKLPKLSLSVKVRVDSATPSAASGVGLACRRLVLELGLPGEMFKFDEHPE